MLESRTRLEPPRWSAAGSSALSRGCPMKHVSAVLVIAALFVVAASGWAQVQQGGPTPSAPPADAPVAAVPPDTLRPAVPPPHPVRRAPSRRASRSSDRVANELNRQELNRVASGNRPAYGPSVAGAPPYSPSPPWYPPPGPYPWPYRPMPWYPPPMWYPPPAWQPRARFQARTDGTRPDLGAEAISDERCRLRPPNTRGIDEGEEGGFEVAARRATQCASPC